MLTTHIHNLELRYEDHSSLFSEQQKEAYQFLAAYIEKIDRMLDKHRHFDNYLIARISEGDFLIVYANDKLDVRTQLFMYNTHTKKLDDSIDAKRLIPQILDEDVQYKLERDKAKLIRELKMQEIFPDANKRLLERAQKTKNNNRQTYKGWDRKINAR